MSSQKKRYLRLQRSSPSRTYFHSIVSSPRPQKYETYFFSSRRSTARCPLLLTAASEDTFLLLSADCGKLMMDPLICLEILGSPSTHQSNDEEYVLQRLETDLRKVKQSSRVFMREDATIFKNDIDRLVASIQSSLIDHGRQIEEIKKKLIKYDVEIEKIKEKYEVEIQGSKRDNSLNEELMMAKIAAAKKEGEMYSLKIDKLKKKRKKHEV